MEKDFIGYIKSGQLGLMLKEMENRIARAKKDLETLEEQIGLIDEKL